MTRSRALVFAFIVALAMVVIAIATIAKCGEDDGGAVTGSHIGSGGKARIPHVATGMTPGSIEGVVRGLDGRAIAGARVCSFAYSPEAATDGTPDSLCTRASADGRYRLPDLLPARYDVHAQAPRFAPGNYRGDDAVDGALDGAVRVASGETRTGIDILLADGGVEVIGVVEDIGGGPIRGARVYAWPVSPYGAAASAETDDDGRFQMWTSPGTILVYARAEGYAIGQRDANAPGQHVRILLVPESAVEGRVIDKETGMPVPRARVRVRPLDGNGGASESTVADEHGRFRLSQLPPGRYKPTATAHARYGQAAESVLLGLAQVVDGVVIEMHPVSSVAGRIIIGERETPCPRGSIYLQSEHWRDGVRGETLGDDGWIEIDAVYPGTYRVTVHCDGYVSEREYSDIVVAAGTDSAEHIWAVRPGGRLQGVVRTPDGRGIRGAVVRARTLDGADMRMTVTAVDGSFVMDGLRPATWLIDAEAAQQVGAGDSVRADVPSRGGIAVEVQMIEGGTIAGTVVDEQGAPAPQFTVWALGARHDDRTQTADDGTFALHGLAPGTYAVVVAPELTRESLRKRGRNVTTVEVRTGNTERVQLEAESETLTIKGRVLDDTGAPIVDAFVVAERESVASSLAGRAIARARWSWQRNPVLTDSQGWFAIQKLSRGNYTVSAYRKGGGEAIAQHVRAGDEVALTIRPTGTIAGTVTKSGGGGAPDHVAIYVRDATGFLRSEEFFKTRGYFAIRDLPAGHFDVVVESPDGAGKAEVELAEGEHVTGLAIRVARWTRVTGRVVAADTGKPLPGTLIELMPATGQNGIDLGSTTSTDIDGRFEISTTLTGTVELVASPADMHSAAYGMTAPIVLSLKAGEIVDVDDLRVPVR